MKAKKLILPLVATIVMGVGVTAYASTTDNVDSKNSTHVSTSTHKNEGNKTQNKTTSTDQHMGKGTQTQKNSSHQKSGLKKITGSRGYDFIKIILKEKLGMTDDEIQAGLDSGKTMHDLAIDKGMSEDEFKNALIEEKNKAIDKAISDGTITQDEGDSAKNIIKNNAANSNCSTN